MAIATRESSGRIAGYAERMLDTIDTQFAAPGLCYAFVEPKLADG